MTILLKNQDVGVTGTNGKTTITYLIESIIQCRQTLRGYRDGQLSDRGQDHSF